MRSIPRHLRLLATLPLLAACATAPGDMSPSTDYLADAGSRRFDVVYTAHVRDVPAGTRTLGVWLPVPKDSPVQSITGLSFDGPVPERMGTESRFGNRVAYFEIREPGPAVDVVMRFTCVRREQVTDMASLAAAGEESVDPGHALLAPDRLVVVDDRIREMAAEVTAGKVTTIEKARAIYDRVMADMTYDKSGEGWGRGDTVYACDVGKGNCTDFHALFMSLCRAADIPAGFEIGLYLPYEKKDGKKVGGYHCWSHFRVPGRTWVPVDISEADRWPSRSEYFFGAHTDNRVTLSAGRDLVLDPPQQGEPLNYFLNPYAEADGAPVPTSKDWSYRHR